MSTIHPFNILSLSPSSPSHDGDKALSPGRTPSRGKGLKASMNVHISEIDHYDYCLVFPGEKNVQGEWGFTDKGFGYLKTISHLGFETFIFKVVGQKPSSFSYFCKPYKYDNYCLIYVLLRAPLEKLREVAERIDLKMKLDPVICEKLLAEGDPEHDIAGVTIRHEPHITPLKPFDYIFAKYRIQFEHLYWKPEILLESENKDSMKLLTEDTSHPFRDLLRLRLSSIILQSRPRYLEPDGRKRSTENLKIYRYLKKGSLLGCYLLHKEHKNAFFRKKWSRYPFKALPVEEIKEYFGEKVALYHCFMDQYTKFLIIPALIAIPFQIAVFYYNNYSANWIPFYSLMLPMWSVVQSEYWKRKETSIALQWGMRQFERDETDRPEFKGKESPSHIDGSLQQYFSSRTRGNRIALSVVATFALCLCVVGCVTGIYVMRFAVSPTVGDSNAQTLASIINSLLIEILNRIYSFLAEALSEWENHRTDSDFENSMIGKIFIFQFINSYASFFYLAFVAQYVGDCPSDIGCMPSLAYNVGIIFATKYLFGTVLSRLILPSIQFYQRKKDYMKRMCHLPHRKDINSCEIEYLKQPINIQKYFFDVYADVTLQIGYTALFASALPAASFYSLLLNVLKIRSEPYIWFEFCQKPLPRGCESIGSWKTIMQVISRISIITNAALIVFTMQNLEEYSLIFRYWIFILFQWVGFIGQALIRYWLYDETEVVHVQEQREKFIVSKLIYKVPDDTGGYNERNPLLPNQIQYHPVPEDKCVVVFESEKK